MVGSANAHGLVPHYMIQRALKMYHVSEDIQVILDDYFSSFRMNFSINPQTRSTWKLELPWAFQYLQFCSWCLWKTTEESSGPANLSGYCYMLWKDSKIMDYIIIICSNEDGTRRMLMTSLRLNGTVQVGNQTKEISQSLSKER